MPRAISFEDFDPNNLPNSIWATYVPTRSKGGAFRTHSRRGDACNAMDTYQSKLYEFVDGRWIERACFDSQELARRVKDGEARCETCRKVFTMKTDTDNRWRRYQLQRGYQVLHRQPNSKLTLPIRQVELCGECIAHGAYPA